MQICILMPINQINHTSFVCLISFPPSYLETPVIDAEVCCQIKGDDVAGARVRAAWFSASAKRLEMDMMICYRKYYFNHWNSIFGEENIFSSPSPGSSLVTDSLIDSLPL